MNRYEQFDLEDFLEDHFFQRWVLEPTLKSDAFWKRFISEYPEKANIIEKAKQILTVLDEDMKEDAPSETRVDQMWNVIQGATVNNPVKRISLWPKLIGVAAAAAAIMLVTTWLLKTNKENAPVNYETLVSESESFLIEKKNESTKSVKITLPDGSEITLKPKSAVSFPREFDNKPEREVYLTGEAFFNVQKNPKRPFFVYSNELITKVLGTSFTIKAFELCSEVEVIVKTGKVSVFSRKEKSTPNVDNITVLTPNYKALYSRNSDIIKKYLVDVPEMIASIAAPPPLNDFQDLSVVELFQNLEDSYGIDIVYDKEIFKNCLLTASFSQETLYDKIDLICKGVEASFSVVDAKIVVTGQGCL